MGLGDRNKDKGWRGCSDIEEDRQKTRKALGEHRPPFCRRDGTVLKPRWKQGHRNVQVMLQVMLQVMPFCVLFYEILKSQTLIFPFFEYK